MQLPITKCDINPGGQVFAYAVGYDWSQVKIYLNFIFFINFFYKIIAIKFFFLI